MAEREDKEFVDGLARGLAVLEAFDAEQPEMTLTEIARKTGHSPAAARRSIHTLSKLGYMRRMERNFALTPKILLLGSAYFGSAHMEEALVQGLREFVERFGDAASVSVLIERNILYIAHQSSGTGLRPVAATGASYPAHCTAMGRVLLAAAPDPVVERYLAGPLEAMTDATTTDPEEFRRLISKVREQGYATAVDQLAYGVTSIAVPIALPSGGVVASVNSSGYTGRLTPDLLVRERLPALHELAGRLSEMFARFPVLLRSMSGAR